MAARRRPPRLPRITWSWLRTRQTAERFRCPLCGAEPGQHCQAPHHIPAHYQRIIAAHDADHKKRGIEL